MPGQDSAGGFVPRLARNSFPRVHPGRIVARVCPVRSWVDIIFCIRENMKKGVKVMETGEAILTGQVDGRQLGNAMLQILPSMPHESPVPLPRFLARALFPQGFVPGRFPAAQPAAQLIPPAGIPAQPIQPPANQVIAQSVAVPQPAPAQPAARRTRDASAHERIQPMSHRVRIVERKGL